MSFITQEFFMLRTSKSHWYHSGSGTNQTPKLYSKGHAERWCKDFNKRDYQYHETDGPWEVVPVDLIFGESYIPGSKINFKV